MGRLPASAVLTLTDLQRNEASCAESPAACRPCEHEHEAAALCRGAFVDWAAFFVLCTPMDPCFFSMTRPGPIPDCRPCSVERPLVRHTLTPADRRLVQAQGIAIGERLAE